MTAAILAIDQAAEIALAHGIGPHGGRRGACLPLAQLFPGSEEEGSIPAVIDLGQIHRAAERGAEFVAHQVRRLGEGVLPLAGDAEAAVAAGFEDRTVNVVRAALGDHHGAGGARQLGAGHRRFYAELLDRVESGGAGLNRAGVAVLQGHAVLHDVHGGVAQAVDLRLAGAAFQARHRNREQGLDAAAVERKLLDASALHDRRYGGAAGGEQAV